MLSQHLDLTESGLLQMPGPRLVLFVYWIIRPCRAKVDARFESRKLITARR